MGIRSLKLIEIESQSPRESNELSEDEQSTGIDDIFRDHTMMEQFIRHLAKEWCVEAVLALIEITQFQQYLMEQFNVKDDGEMTSGANLKFNTVQRALLENNQLPKSQIVHHS